MFIVSLIYIVFITEQQTVVLLQRSFSTSKTYFPIPVENLEDEYRIRSADDGKLFREEYNVSPLFAIRILKNTFTDSRNTPSW